MSDSKKRAILFPGQGAQFVGMAKDLLGDFPFTKEVYEEASDAIGVDLKKLCLEGPEDKLRLTENGQPAILTTSYAWFRTLQKEVEFQPGAAAGHSLGEYSALLAAGAMTLAEAVPLVRERGQLMQEAVPVGKGKMAAVLGLSDEKVSLLCDMATEGDNLVVPVNFNSPGQVVIAGHAEAVDRAKVFASDKQNAEVYTRKFVPLAVSAPFHSPLMGPVVEKFLPSLKKVAWQSLAFPIVFNVDAKLRREADIVDLLRLQIDHPVYWTQSMQCLLKDGFNVFVEPGPGKVLTGLMKRISKEAELVSVMDSKGVEHAAAG